MKKTLLLYMLITLLLPPFCVGAKTVFSGLDLFQDSRLLFKAVSTVSGTVPQSAIFVSVLGESFIRPLTAFPERIDIIEHGMTVQVRNAFGVMRFPVTGGLPKVIDGFSSFSNGAPLLGGRVESMAPSNDGRWILTVDGVTPAYGNLVLLDAASGMRILITENIERPGAYFPASWSPDSRVFVYQKAGRLYYYPVHSAQEMVDERFRVIGEGTLRSVHWASSGDFFYIKNRMVYNIRGSELFARAFYSGFLDLGAIAGNIPFEFDPGFDRFWISPDSASIVISKAGKNLFYFPLGNNEVSTVLPNVTLNRSAADIDVLWSGANLVTVLILIPGKDGPSFLAYRLNGAVPPPNAAATRVFTMLAIPPGSAASLSPDGSMALFWGKQGLVVYDYVNWKELGRLSSLPVYDAAWLGNDKIIIGGAEKIELVSLHGTRDIICLSQADSSGYEENGERFIAKTGSSWYATDGEKPWQQVAAPVMRKPSQASSGFRVYLENQPSGPYTNLPMIRNIGGVGTFPLLPANAVYEQIPAQTAEIGGLNGAVFTHGKRTGYREVALCFDLIDDDRGLAETLQTLARFNVRATFFLNGEFIRRYPDAARDIAEAGHEAASMFFAAIDISDSRYSIDRDFITRGLARNEDEYFRAADAELSLLWHPPHYNVSGLLVDAASSAGYRTIGRDVDPLDWVQRENAARMGQSQMSASDMVDRIMTQKKPGSIIPIRLGVLPGGRGDYLFTRLDVLLDALVRSGYSVTPVSALIERSR